MQPGQDPRVFGKDARAEAEREFQDHVLPRRHAAGLGDKADGAWGLALSGGGIRSATFCLGLVRGLAGNGLLRHFDYLSTVSGGGYLGASLGRLYGEACKADAVEDGVARSDSMWLWWLRNNGRYLTPAGARDLGYAAASIVRGVVSTHLEIGVLILAMAALVLLPHFLVSFFPPFHAGTVWSYDIASTMPSVWGWLLLLPLYACVHQVAAYWYTRDRHSVTSVVMIALVAVAGVLAAVFAGREALQTIAVSAQAGGAPDYAVAKLILAFLAPAPFTAALFSLAGRFRGATAAKQRLLRTKRLAGALWALAIGTGLLLLDWSTWQLTRVFWSGDFGDAMTRVGATILVIATIGRLVLPELQRWMSTTKGPSLNLERLLNALGIVLSVVVAVLWTALLSVLLFPEETRSHYWNLDWASLRAAPPVLAFALVVLGCVAYLLATRRSFDLLNLASLHNYYRARIERAYVSSGNNGKPDGRFGGSALDRVSPERTSRIAPLTEAIDGDDVDVADYRPHAHGGPIHLVNCCLNQSVDDRTGLYNADRKGVAVTVSALGVELGTSFADPGSGIAEVGRLSKWIAISGAAASTGMGSRTSTGFAALLFMSGIRLGYWTRSRGTEAGKGLAAFVLRHAPKPFALVAESLARFPGLSSPVWYVSDGGHFDNTGIHALLKRRAPLIVAADCGADPRYLFGDLESLVRKALIDYRATIEFLRESHDLLPDALRDIVGSPDTIQPGLGPEWLVLGRITYDDGSIGTLLLVKPRRLDAMPFDLVAYADRNPDFPQQTTGDQFFDEAQWESYHQLGLLMGRAITPTLIAEAVAAVDAATPGDASLKLAEQQAERQAELEARTERGRRAGLTVRATVGAGLSLSLVVAAWQGFEQYREGTRAQQRQYEAQALELSQRILNDPVESLLEEEFARLADESARRGDGRYQRALDRLNVRCAAVEDPRVLQQCLTLYRKVEPMLEKKPDPFYDYWFADKRFAYDEARQQMVVSADKAGSPLPMAAGAAAAWPEAYAEADDVVPPPPPPPPPPTAEAMPSPQDRWAQSVGSADAAAYDPRDAPWFEETGAGAGVATEAEPEPEPEQASAPAPAPAPAPEPARCAAAVRLFLHAYDAESIPFAQAAGAELARALGAPPRPVDNVVLSARRKGEAAPYVWTRIAVVYPAGSTPACIERARAAVGDDALLQPIGFGTPDTFELWIPPRTVAVRTAPGT